MSGKHKISDEKMIEKLKDQRNLSNRQIAIEFGITPSGDFSKRCGELRKNNGILEPVRQKSAGRPKPQITTIKPSIEQHKLVEANKKIPLKEKPTDLPLKIEKPFTFEPKDPVIHAIEGLCTVRSVGKDRMVLVRNANMRAITITHDDFLRDPNIVRKNGEKPQVKTVSATELHIGKSVEDLFKSDDQNIQEVSSNQELVNETCEDDMPSQYEAEAIAAIESAPNNIEPIHIDLEMDSISDPIEPITIIFEQEDYHDPEWFDKPIPRKGTVERVIWDKAYKEIEEIQTLRATFLSALNRGQPLPNTYVDKYNRYVSKYGQEVGT